VARKAEISPNSADPTGDAYATTVADGLPDAEGIAFLRVFQRLKAFGEPARVQMQGHNVPRNFPTSASMSNDLSRSVRAQPTLSLDGTMAGGPQWMRLALGEVPIAEVAIRGDPFQLGVNEGGSNIHEDHGCPVMNYRNIPESFDRGGSVLSLTLEEIEVMLALPFGINPRLAREALLQHKLFCCLDGRALGQTFIQPFSHFRGTPDLGRGVLVIA
jgi:hypothetical protein